MSKNLDEILTEKHDKKNVKEIFNRFEFITSKKVWKSRDLKHQKQPNVQILGVKIQIMRWSTWQKKWDFLVNLEPLWYLL